MDNELDLDIIDSQVEDKLKAKNRYEQLSEKVIVTSKERDEALAKVQTEAEAKLQAERDRDFYKDFSVNVSKYPQAAEHQDKILEKVRGGYTTEDAMVAVLAKEGKLNVSSDPTQSTYSGPVEGGSAPTSFEGEKTLDMMTPEEKLAALTEANKTGALADALLGRR